MEKAQSCRARHLALWSDELEQVDELQRTVREERCSWTMVDVAQLVEPRIVIPAVVGSSPIVHPTSSGDADVSRSQEYRQVLQVLRMGC